MPSTSGPSQFWPPGIQKRQFTDESGTTPIAILSPRDFLKVSETVPHASFKLHSAGRPEEGQVRTTLGFAVVNGQRVAGYQATLNRNQYDNFLSAYRHQQSSGSTMDPKLLNYFAKGKPPLPLPDERNRTWGKSKH
jgi:hypothetical protein